MAWKIKISHKASVRILYDVIVNLTSGWIGVVLISPGIFNPLAFGDYGLLLIKNLPFAMLGVIAAHWLLVKNKSL